MPNNVILYIHSICIEIYYQILFYILILMHIIKYVIYLHYIKIVKTYVIYNKL